MQEIWKDINGYEGIYQISNLGNVKNIKTNKLLKYTIDRNYNKLNLSKNNKRKIKYIHRLVAEAFVPNPNNYKEVNHKDNDPSNNNVDNLEWCDRKYNLDYMIKHQNEIKDRHERRIEALEMISYLASKQKEVKSDLLLDIISEDLLGDY